MNQYTPTQTKIPFEIHISSTADDLPRVYVQAPAYRGTPGRRMWLSIAREPLALLLAAGWTVVKGGS